MGARATWVVLLAFLVGASPCGGDDGAAGDEMAAEGSGANEVPGGGTGEGSGGGASGEDRDGPAGEGDAAGDGEPAAGDPGGGDPGQDDSGDGPGEPTGDDGEQDGLPTQGDQGEVDAGASEPAEGGAEGPACGPTTCAAGQVCCNESCGVCTERGGFCTQQICEGTRDDPAGTPDCDLECGPGQVCALIEVQCIRAPCPPQPNCVNAACGGFAGRPCPGAGECVDDPSDDCDPAAGGADCGGVCDCPQDGQCTDQQRWNALPSVCACEPL